MLEDLATLATVVLFFGILALQLILEHTKENRRD